MVLSAVFTLVFPDGLPRGRVQGEGEQPERGWGLSQGLLVQTWCIQSHGTPGAAPKAAERVGQWLCNATLKHLWKAVENGGGPQHLEKGPYHICPQKGEEWWLGGLQVSQSHIHPCDYHGAYPWAHEGEEGDQDNQQGRQRTNWVRTIKLPCMINQVYGQLVSRGCYLHWFQQGFQHTPQCLWFWARC